MIVQLVVSPRFVANVDPDRIARCGATLIDASIVDADSARTISVKVDPLDADTRRRLAALLGVNISHDAVRNGDDRGRGVPVLARIDGDAHDDFADLADRVCGDPAELIGQVVADAMPRLGDHRPSIKAPRPGWSTRPARWLAVVVPTDVWRSVMAWSIELGIDESALIEAIVQEHLEHEPARRPPRPVLTTTE
jgi:hypothetical protein